MLNHSLAVSDFLFLNHACPSGQGSVDAGLRIRDNEGEGVSLGIDCGRTVEYEGRAWPQLRSGMRAWQLAAVR